MHSSLHSYSNKSEKNKVSYICPCALIHTNRKNEKYCIHSCICALSWKHESTLSIPAFTWHSSVPYISFWLRPLTRSWSQSHFSRSHFEKFDTVMVSISLFSISFWEIWHGHGLNITFLNLILRPMIRSWSQSHFEPFDTVIVSISLSQSYLFQSHFETFDTVMVSISLFFLIIDTFDTVMVSTSLLSKFNFETLLAWQGLNHFFNMWWCVTLSAWPRSLRHSFFNMWWCTILSVWLISQPQWQFFDMWWCATLSDGHGLDLIETLLTCDGAWSFWHGQGLDLTTLFNMWWCVILSAWPMSWPRWHFSTFDGVWPSRPSQGLDLTDTFSTCDGAWPSQRGQGLHLTNTFSTWDDVWPSQREQCIDLTYIFQHMMMCNPLGMAQVSTSLLFFSIWPLQEKSYLDTNFSYQIK